MDVKYVALKYRILSLKKICLRMTGRCMEPLFYAGDKVTVIPPSDMLVSNIYLFCLPNGKLALHRLIYYDAEHNRLVFKGDRSKGAEIVRKEVVIGEAAYISFSTGKGGICVNRWYLGRYLFTYLSRLTWKKEKHRQSKILKWIRHVIMMTFVIVASVTRWRYQMIRADMIEGNNHDGFC